MCADYWLEFSQHKFIDQFKTHYAIALDPLSRSLCVVPCIVMSSLMLCDLNGISERGFD